MTWTINGTPELDRVSNYRLVVGVCLACSSCMTIIVALRAWVRIRWVKAIGLDDWLLWIAAACALTNSALTLTQSRLGLSLPLALRPKPNLAIYTIHNFVNRFVYIFATTFFKLSLCSAYMRMIHTTTYKDYRIAVWVATGITVGFGISYFFAILFACAPVAKSWNTSLAGKCFPVAPFYYGTSIINCCIDLMLFLLPIPLLWRLQMNKKKQIGLSLAFGLGTFTTVCSIMRSYSVGKILKSGNSIDFVLWSTVEINVGIMTASIPALAPLLKHLKATTYGSSSSRARRPPGLSSGGIRLHGVSNTSSRPDKKGTITDIIGDASSQSSQENILGRQTGKSREVEIGRGRGYTGDMGIGLGQVQVRREVDLRVEEAEVEKGLGAGPWGPRGREF